MPLLMAAAILLLAFSFFKRRTNSRGQPVLLMFLGICLGLLFAVRLAVDAFTQS